MTPVCDDTELRGSAEDAIFAVRFPTLSFKNNFSSLSIVTVCEQEDEWVSPPTKQLIEVPIVHLAGGPVTASWGSFFLLYFLFSFSVNWKQRLVLMVENLVLRSRRGGILTLGPGCN